MSHTQTKYRTVAGHAAGFDQYWVTSPASRCRIGVDAGGPGAAVGKVGAGGIPPGNSQGKARR